MNAGKQAYEAFHAGRGFSLSEALPWESLPTGLQELWERTAAAATAVAVQAEANRTALAWLAHVRANLPDTAAAREVAEGMELVVSCYLDLLAGKTPPCLPLLPQSAPDPVNTADL